AEAAPAPPHPGPGTAAGAEVAGGGRDPVPGAVPGRGDGLRLGRVGGARQVRGVKARRTKGCSRRGRHTAFPRYQGLAAGPAAEPGRSATSPLRRGGVNVTTRFTVPVLLLLAGFCVLSVRPAAADDKEKPATTRPVISEEVAPLEAITPLAK